MTISVRDVARHASVSPGTVSNYFNRPELVAPDTAERIRAAVAELHYVPHEGARRLRAGGSNVLAYLTFELDNPFGAAVYDGADVRAAELGYSLITASSRSDREREREYLDFFERQRVAGILISPYGDVTSELARIGKRGIPITVLDAESDGATQSSVAVDDAMGGELAASHLLDLGCEQLVFVGEEAELHIVRQRIAGARRALASRSRADMRLEMITLSTRSMGDGYRATREWLGKRASAARTGIIAVNDLVAMGALRALDDEPGVNVPRDIAVVGFDDLEILRGVVPLTSVHRPSHDIGRIGVEITHERITGQTTPAHVLLQPHLVIRDSSELAAP